MSNIIVMAFSPRNIVGCLLKKGLQRGGGSRAPQDPPRYALLFYLQTEQLQCVRIGVRELGLLTKLLLYGKEILRSFCVKFPFSYSN